MKTSIHPILLNKSEKEVMKGLKPLQGRKISTGKGKWKMTYSTRYKRHIKAIEFLKAIGIIEKDENSILRIIRPEYMLTVPALANAFSQKLRSKLSAKIMELIVALNEAEADPQICHTHDFIDANGVMNEAYKSITGQNFEPFLASGDFASDLPIWNEAWALAKEHKFNTIN